MSQKELAEWAFKELQLTTMPSQPTISRLCKKLSHAYDERVVNPDRTRNWRECIQKLKRTSSRGSIKMHAQGLNVSSELIKEIVLEF